MYSFFSINLKIIANPIAGSIAPAADNPFCNHSGIAVIASFNGSYASPPTIPTTNPTINKAIPVECPVTCHRIHFSFLIKCSLTFPTGESIVNTIVTKNWIKIANGNDRAIAVPILIFKFVRYITVPMIPVPTGLGGITPAALIRPI